MENPNQFVKRAEYARMRGWDRSYVTKLERQGRVVMSADGKLVDWAATDAKIGMTADPSKTGVQQRWNEERLQRTVYDPMNDTQGVPQAATVVQPAPAPAVLASSTESGYHQARANREHYAGQMTRIEYEWVTGLLVNRMRVEDAGHTIGRAVRDRIMGLSSRVAPELAAMTDPWLIEQRLTEVLRQALDDLASYGASIMRDATNDPGRGRLPELSRMGRERYGVDQGNTAAS